MAEPQAVPAPGEKCLQDRFRFSPTPGGGHNCIAQEAGDGHRANPTRHRRNGTGNTLRFCERHVTDKFRLAFGRFDPVDPDIDHNRTRLDPISAHEFTRPTAATKISARRETSGRERVLE